MKVKFFCFAILIPLFATKLNAQQPNEALLNLHNRRTSLIFINSSLYTLNYTGLYYLWYKDYSTSNFHFFNDSREWLQMDKIGHLYSAYHLTNFQVKAFQWVGMKTNKSIIFGSLLSFTYISTIEIFDGFSSGWGASVSDLAANAIGVGLYSFQDYYFNTQFVKPKYSHNFNSNLGLRTDLLGKNYAERIGKDYNSQTYWISFNLSEIIPSQSFPKWLNLAFGYGAKNMLGGETNPEIYSNYNRERQFYLAPDINLSQIKTKFKIVNKIFKYLDIIKFPMPTLEYSGKKIYLHPIYF